MKVIKFLLLTLVVVTATSFTSLVKEFPKIELKDLNGNKVKTESFLNNNKITVVSFFATWCKPCQLELDNISEVYEEWKEKYDVEIVAISVDNARTSARLNTLIKSKDWNFTLLKDEKSQIKNELGFQTIPQTFLLNQKGEIVYEHSGYKPGDELELKEQIEALTK